VLASMRRLATATHRTWKFCITVVARIRIPMMWSTIQYVKVAKIDDGGNVLSNLDRVGTGVSNDRALTENPARTLRATRPYPRLCERIILILCREKC